MILGISGGADSVALLDLLVNMDALQLHLIVAHVNHCLRGSESDEDEAFTANLAKQYGLQFENCRIDIRALMTKTGASLEEAARNARYDFFAALRIKYDAKAIVTAHHSDDQAETFLLHLLRGAGSRGLACMPFKDNRSVIRPLLEISRKELLKHLYLRKLHWQEDSSNNDTTLLRNRIRHKLLPLLETYNPMLRKQLIITASQMRQNEDILADHTNSVFRQVVNQNEDLFFYNYLSCNKLMEGLRLRIYRKGLSLLVGNLRGFDYKHIQQIDYLLMSSNTGAQILLPQKTVAIKTSKGILLAKQTILQTKPPQSIEIKTTGTYDLGNGLNITIRPASASCKIVTDGTEALIDLGKTPFPWLIRPYTAADYLALKNNRGSRPINRIMIDHKIPRQFRSFFPLLLADNQPLWLAGVQNTDFASVGYDSSSLVHLVIKGEFMEMIKQFIE